MNLIEMYKSLSEGDEWEYKECSVLDTFAPGYNESKFEWKPYKLGDAINDDWIYRKVERCYVFENDFGALLIFDKKLQGKKLLYDGTKEECEKYIKENEKTWLNESAKEFARFHADMYFARMDGQAPDDEKKLRKVYKDVAFEFSKKILEEVGEDAVVTLHNTFDNCKLKDIILNLGVKL